jgi:hypothetical protein
MDDAVLPFSLRQALDRVDTQLDLCGHATGPVWKFGNAYCGLKMVEDISYPGRGGGQLLRLKPCPCLAVLGAEGRAFKIAPPRPYLSKAYGE